MIRANYVSADSCGFFWSANSTNVYNEFVEISVSLNRQQTKRRVFSWTTLLYTRRFFKFYKYQDMSSRADKAQKNQKDKHHAILRELVQELPNKTCAECLAKGMWYVSVFHIY